MYKANVKIFLATFLAISGVTSCIDEDYDLDKDIDKTVNIGGDELAAPIGDTEKIFIKDMLPLEENGMLKTDADGFYYIETENMNFSQTVSVDEISFSAPKASSTELDFGTIPQNQGAPSVTMELPETTETDVDLGTITLPDEVESIEYVSFEAVAEITISMEGTAAREIDIDELNMTIPDWIETDSDSRINISGRLANNSELTETINIRGIDIAGNDDIDNGSNVLDLNGTFTYDGRISIDKDDIYEVGGSIVLTADVQIRPASGGSEITVTEIQGTLDLAYEQESERIDLGISEELSSGDYTLDLIGASLYLNLDNGSPLDINIEGRIATYGRSGEELSNVGFALPEIPASSASMYLVSQEGGDEGDYEGVQVNGFDELFFRLPSSAGMDVTITSNSYCTIIPGSEYDVNADYFLRVPVKFGSDLDMSYDFTLDNLQESLGKVNIENSEVTLFATLEAMIPAKLSLSAKAMDLIGNEVEGIEISFDGKDVLEIAPQTGIIEQEISINIRQTQDGALENTDSLAFSINISEGNGNAVNSEDYLLLKDISVMIPGGINIEIK